MTRDVPGRSRPVRPAGRWIPRDSAALLLGLFWGEQRRSEVTRQPPDRHREGAARRRSKRDDIVALRCFAIQHGRLMPLS
jgi:hypothetical protein